MRAIPAGQRSFTRGLSGSGANAHEYGDPLIKGRKKEATAADAERRKTEAARVQYREGDAGRAERERELVPPGECQSNVVDHE